MLSIGIRLSIQDFSLAFQRPVPLSIGFLAQYAVKLVLGVVHARLLGVPLTFYVGFILTACVARAQHSIYASYLSKGDVSLSILLTSSTTILSALITPVLTGLLIGFIVPVDAIAMSKTILQVVLVPITLGLVVNTYTKSVVRIIQPIMPLVAMMARGGRGRGRKVGHVCRDLYSGTLADDLVLHQESLGSIPIDQGVPSATVVPELPGTPPAPVIPSISAEMRKFM
ncbi:hypothetical protein GIB67_029519 [Kingdonia uniflora]|uniref:Uncharacterized protein n=1 Tax=Kingdonia uniflora TaxID=39325 RepID=A0A7J7NY11_9MAGN|nr:hypothetical protein GIB67_029519 [Kingdonia uniflora]